jgi:hypothetical protein
MKETHRFLEDASLSAERKIAVLPYEPPQDVDRWILKVLLLCCVSSSFYLFVC